MSTIDQKSTALSDLGKPAMAAVQPVPLFVDVLKAVDDAVDVTPGVRQNMRTAVNRTAHLMSPLGLHGPVQIPEIARKLNKLAPAQLGFKTSGSMSAFKANLRRALRLGGLKVMPGRHVTPLSTSWQALFDSITDRSIKIRLSRFAHIASGQGWSPTDVGPSHLGQFTALLSETCLGSKCTKIVRQVSTAWSEAQCSVPGWPQNDVGEGEPANMVMH